MTTPTPRPGAIARLGRFCYRRRRLVVLLWIVGTVAVVFAGIRFAAPSDNDFAGGKSESAQAQDLIKAHFPRSNGSSLTLAIQADAGVDTPSVRSKVDTLLGQYAQLPRVTSVRSPYAAPGQISPDHKTAFASIQSDQTAFPATEVKKMIADARAASGDGTTLALGGADVLPVETPYGGAGDGIGGAAAMVVILIAFGSLLAMGLTMAAALFGVGTGLAFILLLGHVFPAPSFSPIIAILLGLGVGIDYALIIVTRYRECLADGDEPEEAVVTSIATAGRSVLFAGATVVVAMLGLFVMQQSLLNATAVAASVTVLMTMISAVTLLPALLGFAGRNIDRLKVPFLGRTGVRSPLAERWARTIQRRPVTGLIAGVLIMLVLASPALSMRLTFEDTSTEPHNTSGYASHEILAKGFGAGYDAPLVVVAELPSGGANLAPLVSAVKSTPGVAEVTPVQTSVDRKAAEFIAFPSTGSQNAATPKLVQRLRDNVIPPTVAGTGLRVHIGGPNAGSIDFSDSVESRLPYLIAVVIGLSLLLLLALVRSVAIAIKAGVMTLLSVGASYGVLTAIVQWGWLGHQLGFPTSMPITPWVPLFIFPILFGLSTDYEVFLVSRIREEYDLGADTREAVARGLSRTARVITAAAAIMVLVFLSVLATPDVAVKQFGLGLGVAVFLDATIVRMVLVPSIMELLGKANWWLPGWLDRILPAPELPRRTVTRPVAKTPTA
jgi:uncharacterized membrane protein YdfJ with MMPL/SSD domain